MNFFHGIISPFKVSSGIVVSSRLFEGLTTVCDSRVSSESYKGFENALSSLCGISELSLIVSDFRILFISFHKSPFWSEFKNTIFLSQ